MNSEYEAPNGIVGVQQSLKAQLTKLLITRRAKIRKVTPVTLRVKLTGDGTQITRKLQSLICIYNTGG